MKNSTTKLVALGLSAVLAVGCVGGTMYVRSNTGDNDVIENTESLTAPAVLPSRLSASASGAAPAAFRDETVYVLAGADGSVQKVIVSDWLKNPDGLAQLKDSADLRDVENVKGSETFPTSGSGRVWDAQGGDVYTQGVSEQQVPVEVAVSYTLDGREITPAELAGKSGRVVIRFDYTNNLYEEVQIDGKTEKIYVPFAMMTGVLLDSDTFSNVEVTNGRVFNDGDHTAVVGVALPGMQENLDLDPEDVEIPSYVEITADVRDFEMETTFTVAISDPFKEIDLDGLDDAGDLPEALDKLTGAMDQLMDGSSQLYDGLGELLEKSETLGSAVDQLSAGADALKAGTADLQSGADQLKQGADSLQTGLTTLDGKSEQLVGAAEQTFNALIASANQQLAAAGAQAPELTVENYAEVLDGVAALLGDSPAAGQIRGLKTSLDNYNAFYQGLQQYTAGVAQSAAGAQQISGGLESLSAGAGTLNAGAGQLSDGLKQLKGSVPALLEGVTQLHDGAGELAGGIRKLNDEGIQKIVDAFDGDLDLLADRLQATVDAAKNYTTFAGGDEADGQVKFIYRTAAIEIAG